MVHTPSIRVARLLLAVWFAAGSLFPAALHPCHVHQAGAPAPMQAHHLAHGAHPGAPASRAPDQHQCDCAQDCCAACAATIAETPDHAVSLHTTFVAVDDIAPPSHAVRTSPASHRQPPAIGPPSALL
jgi:hypothetical protein